MADESASKPCAACTGAHRAHTCGVRGWQGGRRPRASVNTPTTPEGMPFRRHALPAPRRVALNTADDESGAIALDTLDEGSPPSPLVGATNCTAPAAADGALAMAHAGGGPAGPAALVTAHTAGGVVAQCSWSRSADVQNTHFLCRDCKHASPKGPSQCMRCGAAAPAGQSSEWAEVRRRREENVGSNARTQRLKYFTQREQTTESLSTGMGTLAGVQTLCTEPHCSV